MAAAACILALAACNDDSGIGTDVDAGSITIQATIGRMTKVMNSGVSSTFEAGDRISVYGWTGGAASVPATPEVDGVRYTLGTDGNWTPATPAFWKSGTDAYYFLGICPERDVTSFTADAYKLLPADYAASDLLIATNLGGVKAADGPVKLSFDHVMAKLNVNLKFRNEFGGTPTVSSITVTALDSAAVNYLTKQVTAAGDAADVTIPAAASAATGYALGFSGLMVPQQGVRTVSVTINGRNYVYEAADDIPLHSGKYTTLGLIVGRDTIGLSTISIADWQTGTNLPDAEAVLQKVHAYVDMGNGLKWATCNVGASKPDDYGDYFAWGETATKNNFAWSTYTYNPSGDGTTFTKYNVGGTTILEAKDDAATANWGGNWRTPTDAEWTWLREKCKWDWKTTVDGYAHNGMLVTSNINGNQIFLPAAGYRRDGYLRDGGSYGWYWSSSLYGSYSDFARDVYFNSGGVRWCYDKRCYGQSVRPVTE